MGNEYKARNIPHHTTKMDDIINQTATGRIM